MYSAKEARKLSLKSTDVNNMADQIELQCIEKHIIKVVRMGGFEIYIAEGFSYRVRNHLTGLGYKVEKVFHKPLESMIKISW